MWNYVIENNSGFGSLVCCMLYPSCIVSLNGPLVYIKQLEGNNLLHRLRISTLTIKCWNKYWGHESPPPPPHTHTHTQTHAFFKMWFSNGLFFLQYYPTILSNKWKDLKKCFQYFTWNSIWIHNWQFVRKTSRACQLAAWGRVGNFRSLTLSGRVLTIIQNKTLSSRFEKSTT